MALLALVGCDAAPSPSSPAPIATSFATELVSFTLGTDGGMGQSSLPGIVLGPPQGAGDVSGSTDTLSLGKGGVVVLGFGDRPIVDGPGADLVVFENAFFAGGNPSAVYAELGEVSVSADGQTWATFPCDPSASGPPWPGCAGWTPVQESGAGGEAFDLATVGLTEARYVRIEDVAGKGSGAAAGFDLDAVGVINRR